MSRIGKLPIKIEPGVTITVDNDFVRVEGPKGKLEQFTMPDVNIEQKDGEIIITRENDERENRSKHGLMRSLIQNMIIGVTKGFEKQLEVNGVGFRVALAGTDLKMNLGFSHEVVYPVPEYVKAEVKQNVITISGISKQQVGQVAAEIRSLKKPEPYKGKGIKYVGEKIIRKSGKSGKDK